MLQRHLVFIGLLIAWFCLMLSSCAYRPDVEQGNLLTDYDIQSIHQGMTENEVRSLLGDPVLIDVYKDDRLVYVYTFQHNHHAVQEKRLIVDFQNGRVTQHEWDDHPPAWGMS